MRRVGAVLLAAVAVAAIVVAGLGAFGSASRAAQAPHSPRAPHAAHRARAAPARADAHAIPPTLARRARALGERLATRSTRRPGAHAPTIRPYRGPHGGSCYVAAGCSAIPCTQFIAVRPSIRPIDRCATVGDRNIRPRAVPVVGDGVLHSSSAPVATRTR